MVACVDCGGCHDEPWAECSALPKFAPPPMPQLWQGDQA